jgi:hypothetical protein
MGWEWDGVKRNRKEVGEREREVKNRKKGGL